MACWVALWLGAGMHPVTFAFLPGLPVGNLLLRQYSVAWVVALLAAAMHLEFVLISALFGTPWSWSPLLPPIALVTYAPWLAGFVGVVLFPAGPRYRDQETKRRWPVFLLAILAGPTGLAQAVQGRWRVAFLVALGLELLLFCWDYYGASRLTLTFGPMGSLRFFLAVLWLAAIWDAGDTQRKARQEQPVQEGSPSPA